MNTSQSKLRTAFTLVELLVVIAIIAILIALLFPAVQQIRATARRMQCSNRIRQCGLAIETFDSNHGHLPAGMSYTGPGYACPEIQTPSWEPGWGWGARILPYLEQKNVADSIDFTDDNYFNSSNWQLSSTKLKIFNCPSAPLATELVECCSGKSNGDRVTDDRAQSNYAGVQGSNSLWCFNRRGNPQGNGLFFNHVTVRREEIRDGLSNTLMLGEVTAIEGEHQSQGPAIFGFMWTNWGVQSTSQGINGPGSMPGGRDVTLDPINGVGENRHDEYFRESGFSSYHAAGANFVFGDGSVHFLAASIDQTVFDNLGTRDGGEVDVDYE